MTNADKFLKDGVSVEEFVNEFHNFCAKQNNNNASSIRLEQFLSRKAQPTLTEDEKVILRSIDRHTFEDIRRNNCGFLELYDECLNEWISCQFKDSLFQFIKNGEEYEIAELLKGE